MFCFYRNRLFRKDSNLLLPYDGRPLLSFDLAEASAYIDEHSNLPKSQDNKSAD